MSISFSKPLTGTKRLPALDCRQPRLARLRAKCSRLHSFNLLDARGAISVTERQGYILRVRTLARAVA